MGNKDIMKVIAEIHNRLYQVPFSGEQMLAVSDCIVMLRSLLRTLNDAEQETEREEA